MAETDEKTSQQEMAEWAHEIQHEIYEQVEREVAQRNRKLYDQVARALRSERAKRFWKCGKKTG